jgi:hypothetical protein
MQTPSGPGESCEIGSGGPNQALQLYSGSIPLVATCSSKPSMMPRLTKERYFGYREFAARGSWAYVNPPHRTHSLRKLAHAVRGESPEPSFWSPQSAVGTSVTSLM